MIEQLTIRDYDLGTSLPLLTHAGTHTCVPLSLCVTALVSAVIQESHGSSDQLEVYILIMIMIDVM